MLRPILAFALAIPLTAQGWVDLTPTSPLTGPGSRAFAAMCFDAAHGYVLMWGGVGPFFGPAADTWSFDGATWTRHAVVTAPGGNGGYHEPVAAMAFHAPANEPLLVVRNVTYGWNGSDWVQRSQQIGSNSLGDPIDVAMAHDPVRAQTVLFVGGRWAVNGLTNPVSETYVWDGFGWSPRPTATVPYPLAQPSMAFDPAAGRLLLATNGNGMAAFFEWNGSNWQQRFLAGAPSAVAGMATDDAHHQVVMLDGVMDAQPNHTWTIANSVCARLGTAIEPARRFVAAMAGDPLRHKVVLYGGSNRFDPLTNSCFLLGDTWEFEAGAAAAYATYGAGCSGSRGVPTISAQGSSLPRTGQTFQLHVGNLPLTAPAFLFLGLSDTSYGPTPLPFALGGLGAPGCSILASSDQLYLLTNVLGSAVWQLPMPNLPGAVFFNQAIALDPAANALGLSTSNGGRGTLGF